MDRRNFLKGAFGGITSAGLLIAAADTDLKSFAESVPIGRSMAVGVAEDAPTIGHLLFNYHGEVVAVVESYKHTTHVSRLTAIVYGTVPVLTVPGGHNGRR